MKMMGTRHVMKRVSTVLVLVAALGLLLALGCSSEDQQDATSALEQAGGAVEDAAESVDSAAAAARDAVAAEVASPVKDCIALAGKMAWGEALEPCTLAAKERPDDLQIRHALQQAQAAAADSAVN
jgi:hypothetical protein